MLIPEDVSAVYSSDSEDSSMSDDDHKARRLQKAKQLQDEKIALLEERGRSTQAFIERIDAERQRISMALHDSAGSIITGLRANLQMVKGDYQNISEDNHYKESINLSSLVLSCL